MNARPDHATVELWLKRQLGRRVRFAAAVLELSAAGLLGYDARKDAEHLRRFLDSPYPVGPIFAPPEAVKVVHEMIALRDAERAADDPLAADLARVVAADAANRAALADARRARNRRTIAQADALRRRRMCCP